MAEPHVWFFQKSTLMNVVDEGPFTDQQMYQLAKEGKLTLKTAIRSPTRTKNQWISLKQVPALVVAINEGGAEAAATKQREAEERNRLLAEAEENARRQKEEKKAAVKASLQAPPSPPPPPIPPSGQLAYASFVAPAPSVNPVQIAPAATSAFHIQRVFVLISSLAGIAGTALPWANLPIVGSVNGLIVGGQMGDGWFVIACFLPAFAICFTPPLGRRLGQIRSIVCSIFALLGSAIGVWKIVVIFEASRSDGLENNPFADAFKISFQPGIGLYMIVAAGLLTMMFLLAFPYDPKTKRST